MRCLTRRPDELRARDAESVEVAGGDILDAETLGPALDGVDIAYYELSEHLESRQAVGRSPILRPAVRVARRPTIPELAA